MKDDIIRDSNGNKITTGDKVNFYCKNDSMTSIVTGKHL